MTEPQQPDPYATPQPGQAPPPAPGGQAVSGQPAFGQPAYGEPAYGQPAYGQAPYGGPQLASWGRRVGGRLIDTIVFGLPATLIAYAIGNQGVQYVLEIIVVVVLGYLNGARGTTPGKSAVGIRLQRDNDGQLIGVGLGIAREFAHILDTFACLVGWLWPLWDSKRQTFADKIVGSVAVRV